jgi:DHA2 family multidrug resistance protein
MNLRFAVSGNTPLLFLLITAFRFVILSTVFIIPQYLTTIQHYRALETGDVLIWIALPQLLVAPIVATILLFVDPRIPLAFGFALVGLACFMAGQLTQDWVSADFLPSQIVQAIGQSFALTSMVWYVVRNIDLRNVLTFGAVMQTGRLFGAELGTAFMQTFVRMREQIYSNLVGLHVTAGSTLTDQRLQDYAHAVITRSVGQAEASGRATVLLAQSVQKQAFLLAYIDGFMVIGYVVMGLLILALFLRAPPPIPAPPTANAAAK